MKRYRNYYFNPLTSYGVFTEFDVMRKKTTEKIVGRLEKEVKNM